MIVNGSNTQGGHWLTLDENNQPTYVPNCNLREARKIGATPSVTGIDGILEKEGLNRWKLNNAVRRAIHSSRLENEDDDSMVKRVLSDSSNENLDAMTRGTEIHDQAERVLLGKPYNENDPFIQKLKTWCDDNIEEVYWCEKTLMHPSKIVGGRADALVKLKSQETPVLLDWKSQKFAYRSGKCVPHFYDSYVRQLAAYADCVSAGQVRPRIMSVAINTIAPTAPVAKLWTEAQQANALRQFMLIAELWCLIKNYDPRTVVIQTKPKPQKELKAA